MANIRYVLLGVTCLGWGGACAAGPRPGRVTPADVPALQSQARQQPTNPQVRFRLAAALLAAGRCDTAVIVARSGQVLAPADPRGPLVVGACQERDGRYDLAFGTSRWSSKLIHGGLRYLASGQLDVAHEIAVGDLVDRVRRVVADVARNRKVPLVEVALVLHVTRRRPSGEAELARIRVAVGEQEPSAVVLGEVGVVEDLDPERALEPPRAAARPNPVVVVSAHEAEPDAAIGRAAEGTEDDAVARRRRLAVLEPEVEEVAVDEEAVAQLRHAFEKRDQRLVVLGQSFLLFPYELDAIREAADAAKSILGYDGSHVLGLIAGGEFHSCAVKTAGSAWCWGENAKGQLGDNTNTNRSTAVVVRIATGQNPPLTGVVEIVAGQLHSCARLSGQTVSCWGFNASGQLGIGSTSTIGDNNNEMPPGATTARSSCRTSR